MIVIVIGWVVLYVGLIFGMYKVLYKVGYAVGYWGSPSFSAQEIFLFTIGIYFLVMTGFAFAISRWLYNYFSKFGKLTIIGTNVKDVPPKS